MKKKICALLALLLALPLSSLADMSGEETLRLETRLHDLGYLGSVADEQCDDETFAALRSFKKANGLEETNEMDEATISALNSENAVKCKAYLIELAKQFGEIMPLQMGSQGAEVTALQKRLYALGYLETDSDSVFGEATRMAVCRFQMANGLEETGIADSMVLRRLTAEDALTWEAFLTKCCAKPGDTGLNVRSLQRRLAATGFFKGDCTGNYGEQTQQAVSYFQRLNDLEVTGSFDLHTCRKLLTGDAVVLRRADVLTRGDSNADVTRLQKGLAANGYFDRNVTGVFGATTETAVVLFQMAHGLEATGIADLNMVTLLEQGSVLRMEAAAQTFGAMLAERGRTAQESIGNAAAQLRGTSFRAEDEDMYKGFSFVQYVCVSMGVPLVYPQDLTALASEEVTDPSHVEAGDILVFRLNDWDSDEVLMAIGLGNERAVYATADSEWVLESGILELSTSTLYRWHPGAA